MNIKDLQGSLEYLFKAEITPFIWGHAGIGKTTVLRKYAEEQGYKFFPFYLGTQSDIGDILGLASFVKDENGTEVATQFATPLWLKNTIEYCEENPDSGAIIFLDEFNRARADILQGMFSLALDKTFHMIKLPKNCHVVAAGNPPTDEYRVTDVNDTALMARFAHIKLEPTFQEWKDYAQKAGFEDTLVGFLQDQPTLLEDAKSDFELPIKVDRRSYERVNRLFKVGTPSALLDQLMQGIIGTERLVAYKLYLQSAEKPLTAAQVFNREKFDLLKQWSNPKDTKSSYINTTCDNLLAYMVSLGETGTLTNKQALALVEFMEIIPVELSFTHIKKWTISEAYCFNTMTETGMPHTEKFLKIATAGVVKNKETTSKDEEAA